jgi:hypothetical protein
MKPLTRAKSRPTVWPEYSIPEGKVRAGVELAGLFGDSLMSKASSQETMPITVNSRGQYK